MAITCDPAKREATLRGRNLDFLEAAAVFTSPAFMFEDIRAEYGRS